MSLVSEEVEPLVENDIALPTRIKLRLVLFCQPPQRRVTMMPAQAHGLGKLPVALSLAATEFSGSGLVGGAGLAYAIGVAQPVSMSLNTYGTEKLDPQRIHALVLEHFDLRPYGILRMLDLLNAERIKYRKTAAYGHFGREDLDLPWEDTGSCRKLA